MSAFDVLYFYFILTSKRVHAPLLKQYSVQISEKLISLAVWPLWVANNDCCVELLESVFLSIYLQIDGYLRS